MAKKISPASLVEQLADMEDPRRDEGKRHPLVTIVVMALCAVMGHANNWPEIEAFAEAKAAWFSTFLPMPHGVPSQYTFRRVFLLLNPEELQERFLSWVSAVQVETEGDVVAIDGKTVRRAFTQGGKKGAIHMVNAWSSQNQMVLGQVKVSKKSNEVTAIPQLLDMLLLNGCIVTIDAMGCQREIAAKIVDQGADYLLALKRNQDRLYEDVVHLFKFAKPANFQQPNMDYAQQVGKGHGRVEKRRCWVIADPEWLDQLRRQHVWSQLRSVVKVQASRSIDSKRSKPDIRYYISSCAPDAARLLQAVRTHWEVENQVHWVLDIAFREDDSRLHVGNGQENLAALRRWALNLIRQDKTSKGSINTKRLRAGWDTCYLEKLLLSS